MGVGWDSDPNISHFIEYGKPFHYTQHKVGFQSKKMKQEE